MDGVLFNKKYTALTSYLVVEQLSTGNGIYMYLLMNKYDIATMMLSRLSSATFTKSFLTLIRNYIAKFNCHNNHVEDLHHDMNID